MARQVFVIEEAWIDIREVSDYYERISSSLRRRFEDELILYLEKFEDGIVSFRKYKQKYRRVNMPFFPFKIYYKEDNNTVVVAALIHAARGSYFLKRRLL